MNDFLKIIFFLFLGILLAAEDSFPQERKKQIGERFGEKMSSTRPDSGFSNDRRGDGSFLRPGERPIPPEARGTGPGLAGWLTRHRREMHRAWMGAIDQGSRLIPLRLEEESVVGDSVRKKTTLYDYSARKIFMETIRDGERSREEMEIPPGVYYDNPLTAFYNFRYGVYGKVAPEVSSSSAPSRAKDRGFFGWPWLRKRKPFASGRRTRRRKGRISWCASSWNRSFSDPPKGKSNSGLTGN